MILEFKTFIFRALFIACGQTSVAVMSFAPIFRSKNGKTPLPVPMSRISPAKSFGRMNFMRYEPLRP